MLEDVEDFSISAIKNQKSKVLNIENSINLEYEACLMNLGGRRKKTAILLIVIMCVVLSVIIARFTFNPEGERRETVLDGIVHIERKLKKVPEIPPWCDELDLKKSYVNIGDCKLYVEEEGKGIPIVLLHGGPGGAHHDFHPYFSRAKDFARIIYYDQRGCGLSDYKPGERYSVEQAVDDLEKLKEALGIDRWVVLGHSYGGYLAQRYAIKYSDSVEGLILVSAEPGLFDTVGIEGVIHKLEPTRQYDYISKEENARMKEVDTEIKDLVRDGKIPEEEAVALLIYNLQVNGDWKRQNFYKPTEEEFSRRAIYEWKHDGVFNEMFLGQPGFNSIMSMDLHKKDLEGAFENCPIPTTIIEGKWDLTWNVDKAEKIHKNHPGSEMAVFERSGHAPFADEPEKFFGLLEEFVTKLPQEKDTSQWRGYLEEWEREKKEDPILQSEAGQEEKEAIRAFEKAREELMKGKRFEDYSSPLNSFLTLLSNLHFRDAEAVRAQYVMDPEMSGIKLTREVLEGWESELSDTRIYRAPPPPKDEQGELWPIYLEKGSQKPYDTYVFVSMDGEWKVAFNLEGFKAITGDEEIDWRQVASFSYV